MPRHHLSLTSLFIGLVNLASAQFQVSVGSEPDPWNVEVNQENVVSFVLNLDDQPTDEFTVTTTKCNDDNAYSMSSTDSVSDMSVDVTFTNQVNIVQATFCAEVVLTWNNDRESEEVASLTFEMALEATESDTEILEIDTPETAIQVTPQEDEVVETTSVIRPQPKIDLAVQNASPLYFGEDVLIVATSPTDYQFQLITAQTQGSSDTPHDLTIVDGGPGPTGVIFKINGFRLVDFSGSPITITLVIAWDVNGFDVDNGNSNRRLQPRNRLSSESASQSGTGQYQLQIDAALPQEAISAQHTSTYSAIKTVAFVALAVTTAFFL